LIDFVGRPFAGGLSHTLDVVAQWVGIGVTGAIAVAALFVSIVAYRSGGLRLSVRAEKVDWSRNQVKITVRNHGAAVIVEHIGLAIDRMGAPWLMPDSDTGMELPKTLEARIGRASFMANGERVLDGLPTWRRFLPNRRPDKAKVRGVVILRDGQILKSVTRVSITQS
jgi:hypothetical protein